MTSSVVMHGDCLELMPMLGESSVDSIVTDPPYGLSFMGKDWDHGVPGVHFWQEALKVMKPGGYLLAFGGSRTFHRLACAIEDAGFELRDTIMWVYGSGFPKSHNGPWGGTALKPAHEPVIVARKPLDGTVAANVLKWGTGGLNIDGCRVATEDNLNGGAYSNGAKDLSAATSYATGVNAGEYKQPEGRWPANLIHDGSDEVLALFPDSKGQQGDVRGTEASHTGNENTSCYGEFGRVPTAKRNDSGSAARFFQTCKSAYDDDLWQDLNLPSESAATADQNLSQLRQAVFFALEAVAKEALPEGLLWDVSLSKAPTTPATPTQLRLLATTLTRTIQTIGFGYWLAPEPARLSLLFNPAQSVVLPTLTGTTTITISRWLSDGSADPVTFSITPTNLGVGERGFAPFTVEGSARFRYCAKASKTDRDEGLEAHEDKVLAMSNQAKAEQARGNLHQGESEMNTGKIRKNHHPTVKPTDLMRYLCRLVTPPSGTVLDPFTGSGSTGKAAVLEGFGFIGCELRAEYVAIAQARIEAATK